MKIFSAILILLMAHSAFSQDRALLMVSVPGKAGLFRLKSASEKIISQFRKVYQHELPLVVIPHATQEDLYRELKNSQNKAIFWVSHANSFDTTDGLSKDSLIVDHEGTNVKDLFQEVHPNLNLLAVLGCKALPILKDNIYPDSLKLVSFNEKISSKKAIKISVEALSQAHLTQGTCEKKEGLKLTIKRKLTGKGIPVSVKVLNRGKVIALFNRNSEEPIIAYTQAPESLNHLKLVFDTGKLSPDQKYDIGTFSVESDADGFWAPFTGTDGIPLGVTQNIYRYKGTLPQVLKEYSTFNCH